MKRIITAATAALIILNTAVLAADGRYMREPEPFDGSAIVYEPYDIKEIDTLIGEAETLFGKKGNDSRLRELLGRIYDEFTKVQYAATSARLMSDKYYSAEVDKSAEAIKTTIDVAEKLSELIKYAYESGYAGFICDILDMDENEVSELIDTMPTERFYALSRREAELTEKYSDIYGDNDACAELYIELVKLRNEIAAECGYDNYVDYANEIVYDRDYTEDDIEQFSEAVAEYISPLWGGLVGISMMLEDRYEGIPDDKLKATVADIFYDIDEELGRSYSFMMENNLYDIGLREGKNSAAGAYTVILEGKWVPYLFTSDTDDSIWRVTTFIHESGHACSLMHTPDIDAPWVTYLNTMSIDTCEVHSQGLELLCEHYFGKLFGSDAAYARYAEMATMAGVIMDGCYFNEWQTRMYKEKEPTVEKANKIAAELLDKYYGLKDYKIEDAQDMWVQVQHNFVAPMYYISYAVSAMAAMDIYAEAITDRESAVDKYMRLSAMGGFMPFTEALYAAELHDIFDDETIKYISKTVGADAGFAYLDIDPDAWYVPYYYETSHISEGRTDDLFMPDAEITRGEVVELLGRMHEYYEDEPEAEATVTFEDVDKTDDSVKYIAWAEGSGFITGYSETEFGPDDPITREQLVTVLCRMNGAKADNQDLLAAFCDSALISDWATAPFAWAVENGIINGRDDNTIAPRDKTTRAEAVKIAAMYIEKEY